MKKQLGGDRLGAGGKMEVDLHGYDRSTHDLSYVLRTTASFGTLVPFMVEVALPGDTWDLDLQCELLSNPTVGPLFSGAKVQLDVFQGDLRLYNSWLSNYKLRVGMKMSEVKLPVMTFRVDPLDPAELGEEPDIDNMQINPSSILSYLGLRGIGLVGDGMGSMFRQFNMTALAMYWDVVKNYYCNKQERNAWVIHNTIVVPIFGVSDVMLNGEVVQELPAVGSVNPWNWNAPGSAAFLTVNKSAAQQKPEDVYIQYKLSPFGSEILEGALNELGTIMVDDGVKITAKRPDDSPTLWVLAWRYRNPTDEVVKEIDLVSFPLEDIDSMREQMMATAGNVPFDLGNHSPMSLLLGEQDAGGKRYYSRNESQEGLAVKTYQSDVFNNWLNEEDIDGAGGITDITTIDVTGGLKIDDFVMANKVYKMLNRILVSDGTYSGWIESVYDHEVYSKPQIPVYVGGLIKEMVFQEVISQAQSGDKPQGTLSGRGRLSDKHKGGNVVIKVGEVGYIMGLISITPRIDYSQGNRWDLNLRTIDDLHKPALDGIGFQELITEKFAWWDTWNQGAGWVQKSIGKQPAWLDYMTNHNRVKGNFAIRSNQMFMVFARRYKATNLGGGIAPLYTVKDMTTYIDPRDYNHLFADTSLDSQNLWVNIGVKATVRRKMSGKIMPNI